MFYKVVQKKGFGEGKFYASACSGESVSFEELVKKVASSHGIFSGDVIRVVYALQEVVFRELGKGNGVRLGDLGSFRVVVESDGVSDACEVSGKCIRGGKVLFRAGKGVKRLLSGVVWRR